MCGHGRVWASMLAVERSGKLPGGINCRGCFMWWYVHKVSGVCGGHGIYVGERAICGEREREGGREELAGGRYLNQPQTIYMYPLPLVGDNSPLNLEPNRK